MLPAGYDKTGLVLSLRGLRAARIDELIFIEPRVGYLLLVNDEPDERRQDIVGRNAPLKVLVLRVANQVGEHLIILFRHVRQPDRRDRNGYGCHDCCASQ